MKDIAKMTTISVREDVKKRLDRMRKGRDWSSFLLEIAEKAEKCERAKAMEKLREILSEEELDKMAEESRLFRKSFSLRLG